MDQIPPDAIPWAAKFLLPVYGAIHLDTTKIV